MSRKGFTLLEAVLGVVVLLILAGLALGLLLFVERSRVGATEGLVFQLGTEASVQARLTGFPPATLEPLIPRMNNPRWLREGKFVDAWENPIGYRVDGKTFQLWSWGPDGISGTADDIIYERK